MLWPIIWGGERPWQRFIAVLYQVTGEFNAVWDYDLDQGTPVYNKEVENWSPDYYDQGKCKERVEEEIVGVWGSLQEYIDWGPKATGKWEHLKNHVRLLFN